MKNKFLLLILVISLSLSNCTRQTENRFTLEGRFIDRDSGIVILQYGVLSTYRSDTAEVRNGRFTFSGPLEGPVPGYIKDDSESNRIQLFLEPGVMKITMSDMVFGEFTLTGSRSHDELAGMNELLRDSHDPDSLLLSFVINNPGSYLSAWYLRDLGYRSKLTLDSLKLIFNGLDMLVQSSRYGRMTLGVIRSIENTTPGNYATDFSAPDVNGQTLSLSQFRDKNIVLLDFWASWCVPCRNSFPHLKEIYKKYHPKGLEIVGIATLDRDVNSWKTAIQEDSIHIWRHTASYFRDGTSIYEDISLDYPLGPIPRSILIDRDGRILGHWVGQKSENEAAIDTELSRLFDK